MTTGSTGARVRIPRDSENDYTAKAAAERRAFVESKTGAKLDDLARYSFDPSILPGNIENFVGVAQVPIGLAGPLRVNGEHAKGDFYVPMATTEGTLVASYSRGMRLLTECGGAKATIVQESMQRSPAFIFADALEARAFGFWVEDHFAAIKAAAEATTRSGRLQSIVQYAVGPLRHLRFNFTTGDAAGQNMTGRAAFAACEWIKANYPGGARYILSGNMDTDKKHSRINMLATRGRRVVAEAIVKKDALKALMRVEPKDLFYARQISQAGAFLAGSANNGAHAANGLAAMFIATGQDVANLAEFARGRRLQPAARRRRLLLVDHPDLAHRRNRRRRHGTRDPERVPRNPRLPRRRQGGEARRNLRGGGARGRDFPVLRDSRRRLKPCRSRLANQVGHKGGTRTDHEKRVRLVNLGRLCIK